MSSHVYPTSLCRGCLSCLSHLPFPSLMSSNHDDSRTTVSNTSIKTSLRVSSCSGQGRTLKGGGGGGVPKSRSQHRSGLNMRIMQSCFAINCVYICTYIGFQKVGPTIEFTPPPPPPKFYEDVRPWFWSELIKNYGENHNSVFFRKVNMKFTD